MSKLQKVLTLLLMVALCMGTISSRSTRGVFGKSGGIGECLFHHA